MFEPCILLDDFSDNDARAWQSVNDGVMGGRSSGAGRVEGDLMVFSGVINTNGGGFASLRRPLMRGSLTNVSHLRLRLLPDSRRYRVILRSDQTYFGRSVSYQADIPDVPAGQWSEVTVRLSDLKPSIFGRGVPAARLAPDRARTLGLIISDGRDGPFEMKLDWIKACRTVSQAETP